MNTVLNMQNSVQPDAQASAVGEKNVAREIYELASKFQTPLVPGNFETWYSYVTNKNIEVVKKVDRLVKGENSFNPSEFKHIHTECFDASTGTLEQEAAMESELNNIMDVVNSYMSSSDEFSNSLDEVDKKISVAELPEDFKNIVAVLLAENKKIKEQANVACENLAKSQEVMDEIRVQLEETQDEALRDPLTNIGNRRSFDTKITSSMIRAKRNNTDLCVVFADLDKFKSLNDSYGHLVGDAVLKYFASLLSDSVTDGQICARYGGEEFAMILPATTIEEASVQVDVIRTKLEASNLVTINNRRPIGPVTSSFGIAKYVSGENQESLMQRVDDLLYKAKEDGRNCIRTD